MCEPETVNPRGIILYDRTCYSGNPWNDGKEAPRMNKHRESTPNSALKELHGIEGITDYLELRKPKVYSFELNG